MVCPPALTGVGKRVSFAKDVRTRTTLPGRSTGRGLSLHDDGRTRAIARRVSRGHAEPPGISASGIDPRRKTGLTVSRFGRKALRQNGRTATEARVRSSSEVSAFQAETERWSGIRTRVTMSQCHLLYQTELSFVQETGIEPIPSGVQPDALHELRPAFLLHSAEHETGDRPAPVGISESPNPWPSEGPR